MRFKAGDWVLSASCAKCRRASAVFSDALLGAGPIEAPVKGVFSFACAYCRADNLIDTRDLRRCRVKASALEQAA